MQPPTDACVCVCVCVFPMDGAKLIVLNNGLGANIVPNASFGVRWVELAQKISRNIGPESPRLSFCFGSNRLSFRG